MRSHNQARETFFERSQFEIVPLERKMANNFNSIRKRNSVTLIQLNAGWHPVISPLCCVQLRYRLINLWKTRGRKNSWQITRSPRRSLMFLIFHVTRVSRKHVYYCEVSRCVAAYHKSSEQCFHGHAGIICSSSVFEVWSIYVLG